MSTSIEDKLASLRFVDMPPERKLAITSLVGNEVAKYRRKYRNGLKGHRRINLKTTMATMLAIAAVCIIVPFIVIRGNHPTESQGEKSSSLTYSENDLIQIKKLAGIVGVTPIIPTHDGLNARFETVKEDGIQSLAMNYSGFKVVESNAPLKFAPSVGLVQTISLASGTMGTYFTVDNAQGLPSTFLYFKFSQTYTAVESVKPGVPLSAQQLQEIANSLKHFQ